MAAEIERKFLLDRLPSGLGGRDRIEIEQGYLAVSEAAEVRLRRAGEHGTLTVKRGHGRAREEFEVEISASQSSRSSSPPASVPAPSGRRDGSAARSATIPASPTRCLPRVVSLRR
jgi:hypothetical protein